MSFLETYDTIREVGKLWMKGYSVKEISAELGIKAREVNDLLNDWHQMQRRFVEESGAFSDQIHNIITEVDQHWRMLVKEAWEALEEAKALGQTSNRINAINAVARIQKDRAAVFADQAKADDAELLKRLDEQERTHEVLKQLLRELADKHPEVKRLIYERLAELSTQAEVIEVTAGEPK